MIRSETILDAIGMIEESVVLDARGFRPKKRRIFRSVLIAACLGAILIGTAFAAEIIWGVFPKGIRDDPEMNQKKLFEVVMKGTTVFQLDEVLADIEVLAAERDNSPEKPSAGRAHVAAFPSWQAAGEYIGISLAENAVLEQYPQTESLVGPTRDDAGNPLFLHVSNSYLVDNATVFVSAYLRTDHAGDESRYTPGISFDPAAMTVEEETYRMADGSSAVIFSHCDDAQVAYTGVFVKEGIFYWVTWYGEDHAGSGLQQLHRIMAAYE